MYSSRAKLVNPSTKTPVYKSEATRLKKKETVDATFDSVTPYITPFADNPSNSHNLSNNNQESTHSKTKKVEEISTLKDRLEKMKHRLSYMDRAHEKAVTQTNLIIRKQAAFLEARKLKEKHIKELSDRKEKEKMDYFSKKQQVSEHRRQTTVKLEQLKKQTLENKNQIYLKTKTENEMLKRNSDGMESKSVLKKHPSMQIFNIGRPVIQKRSTITDGDFAKQTNRSDRFSLRQIQSSARILNYTNSEFDEYFGKDEEISENKKLEQLKEELASLELSEAQKLEKLQEAIKTSQEAKSKLTELQTENKPTIRK